MKHGFHSQRFRYTYIKDHIDRNARASSKYIVSGIEIDNKTNKRTFSPQQRSKQNQHSSSSPLASRMKSHPLLAILPCHHPCASFGE